MKNWVSDTDDPIGYVADIIFNSQDLPSPFQVQEMKLERLVICEKKINVEFDNAPIGLIYENESWKIIN